jgi:predicted nucleic acid-binding protein
LNHAYVDSSVIVAILLGERTATTFFLRLKRFDRVSASGLLDAELRSVCRRENRPVPMDLLREIEFAAPRRDLTPEIERVLSAGYVRGADCWHLATALYLSPDPSDLVFLTLDDRQREVAAVLGFAT